jgi:hypothetical protein
MTKIERSECAWTMQKLHHTGISYAHNLYAWKEKSSDKRRGQAQCARAYRAMPLGLPKTRSALLVLIVRGLSGISSYNLDACLEVLTARDLVVSVGETVRPSLGTAAMGVTPPETRIRDVGMRLRRLVRQFSYHFSREVTRKSERQSPKTHSRRRT